MTGLDKPTPKFKAATWNVFHGTSVDTLLPVLEQLLAEGVSVLLLQEAAGADIATMLRSKGLKFARLDQCLVAWDPIWACVNTADARLSETRYSRVGGALAPPNRSPLVVLSDPWGRTLTAVSYHMPAGVQRGGKVNPKVPKRTRIIEESFGTMRDLAASAETRAILFGGDDNFDERRGRWDVLLRPFTRLKLVQAPRPTHGRRRIDDFRVRHLKPGKGSTLAGGGDHRVHVREFSW